MPEFRGNSMSLPISDQQANARIPAQIPRLDGWKEIADYLGKAERTAKRWGRDRNLPVHRVPGGTNASVYAYPAELDKWLAADNPAVSERDGIDDADGIAGNSSPIVSEATEEVERSRVDLVESSNTVTQSNRQMTTRLWLAAALAFLAIAFAFAIVRYFQKSTVANPSVANGQPKTKLSAASSVPDSERAAAREYYLKGRYEWSQRTPESLNRALDSFTQSIVHDPGNAKAYAGLADTYNLLEVYSTMPETDTYPRAIAAARKAAELDDTLAEAHRSLAFAEFYGGWKYAESEKEFRRAIQMDPRDAVARRWYANAFAVPGRFEESLEEFDEAQRLDPASHSTLSDKGIVLFEAGKTAEGISLLKEVERTDPEFYSPHFYLMLISLQLHDYPAYLKEGQKAAEIKKDPVLSEIIASARAGYARNGQRGLLKGLYEKQEEYYASGSLHGAMLAITCVIMGKRQEALHLLEVAYDSHEMDALWCLQAPALITLKNEPRYKALVKKINFPAGPEQASPSYRAEIQNPRFQAPTNP
jgi:tetratricopeptide (TPR) repeat protein